MAKSIISNEKKCLVCGKRTSINKHHIFAGNPNRQHSEHYGCWCYLCYEHHHGSVHGVHFNKELDLKIKQLAQKKFEETHSREEFIRIFGKNYL